MDGWVSEFRLVIGCKSGFCVYNELLRGMVFVVVWFGGRGMFTKIYIGNVWVDGILFRVLKV